jgi:hypothetical protein
MMLGSVEGNRIHSIGGDRRQRTLLFRLDVMRLMTGQKYVGFYTGKTINDVVSNTKL